ncbi:hypothetical protein [Streptomyces sp. CBMA29]|uniref:hypothetical protein n=1 Tax=Streptomyces sp. CBMA29 TaxID=1896314 RepID=UPI001661B502|nr:hypothetical protein [Streptomyces sp. CBMA29]MBD0736463.1 hypothetical protein [Streptomyces sp. CBMA29]
MTDPITSKYDTTPLPDPPADGTETPSPDHDKNLDGLVPTDKVVWSTPPSFNTDPTDSGSDPGSGPDPNSYEAAADLKIDLSAVRVAEKSMLTESRGAVDRYEELRKRVMAVKGHVFGQGAQDKNAEGEGHTSLSSGYDPSVGKSHANPFAETGEKFGADMNPAQDRALLQIGSTLEKLGEYIALLNHSGQVYAHTDRESRFPPPPAG